MAAGGRAAGSKLGNLVVAGGRIRRFECFLVDRTRCSRLLPSSTFGSALGRRCLLRARGAAGRRGCVTNPRRATGRTIWSARRNSGERYHCTNGVVQKPSTARKGPNGRSRKTGEERGRSGGFPDQDRILDRGIFGETAAYDSHRIGEGGRTFPDSAGRPGFRDTRRGPRCEHRDGMDRSSERTTMLTTQQTVHSRLRQRGGRPQDV